MKISELILAIGDDNVQFQNLDACADSLNMNGPVTKITFGTEQRISVKGTERLGLVLWLDRGAVATALDASRKRRTGADRHNVQAPQIVKRLLTECESESECMVALESVILGVMLFHRPDPKHAAEFLDSMTMAVIERMGQPA